MHRFGIYLTVLLMICGLAGCAALYSYRNIDRYIQWSLDDYINWDAVQESQLRTRLAAQLTWHRQTQLPRYRAWLATIDSELDNDIDVARLTQSTDELQTFWQDTMAHTRDDIAAQLASLSDQQVDDLIAVLREKQADLKSEYDDMTAAELIKKRNRDMTKSIKYWLGPLDTNQIALIDTWARRLADGRAPWLNNRARWIDSFAQALSHRHQSEVFTADIQRLFVTPRENWSAEYREQSQQNLDAGLQLIVELNNSRTPKQRKVERERVTQWLGHLDQLAAP